MAERRMFAKTIIDSDAFLDMPQSTQLLYFHLSMRADDDGFINKPKSIMREVGCKDDDLKILASKKFLIPFESGVVVIKHWKIHNYIAKDRYTETKYKNEKAKLSLDENNSYTECIHLVDDCETQVSIGKVRLGKVKVKDNPPTIEELTEYAEAQCPSVDPKNFLDYYTELDWHDKEGNPVLNWKNKMGTWYRRDLKKGWLPPVQPKKEYRPSDDPVYAEWLKLQEQREAQE
jgi:hypothetical protein